MTGGPGRGIGRALLALAVTLAPAAAAQAQVAAGLDFQVQTITTSSQYGGAGAFDKDGDFVLVWSSLHTGNAEVRAQRYASNGVRRGSEFQVNTFTTEAQYAVSAGTPVAMRPDGRFVVVWSSIAQDGDSGGIFGQRFDANGVRLGAEFQVHTTTASGQYQANVAVSPHGTFVVVWHSDQQDGSYYGVFGQLFDAGGNRIGGEFQVNSTTADDQLYPRVAMDAAGGFAVVWQTVNALSGIDAAARVFSPAGVPLGPEFRVNLTNAGDQYSYGVSRAPDGRFVVTWDGLTDGSVYGVFARRFDAGGTAVGVDFLVNTNTTGRQAFSTVAMDQNANFVATWHSEDGDGSGRSVQAQRFRNTGAKRGAEVRVNSYTTGDQWVAQIASDGAGNFLVNWRDEARDGSNQGVYARRFQGIVPALLAVDTAGNGVLEPGESTNVRPQWRNVSGAAQSGVTGTLTGDAGPGAHAITDGAATYGTLSNGATVPCGDCYGVSVGAARPAVHWDVTALESLSPDTQGQEKIWTLHVGSSFTDASGGGFYPFIEAMLHHGVTGGCAASLYCPANTTTRQEMAVFVLVAREGALFSPRPCTSAPFADVPAASGFCPFIAELARRGVAGGCGGGNYCPGAAVTRQEMAVFALATVDPVFTPPPCATPPFPDVSQGSPFCPAIAELQRRGVIAGCGGGNFCPASPVTRQEMAVFISGAFGLPLYGP